MPACLHGCCCTSGSLLCCTASPMPALPSSQCTGDTCAAPGRHNGATGRHMQQLKAGKGEESRTALLAASGML